MIILAFIHKLYKNQPGRVGASGGAEVDFVGEYSGHILPLEAKARINPRSKSLKSFDQKFNPPVLFRTNLLNLKKDDKFVNIPCRCSLTS